MPFGARIFFAFSETIYLRKVMREIRYGLDAAKKRVGLLAGRDITLVVNRGRNKIEKLHGRIDEVHDSIFTLREVEGKVNSFSYSDVLTKSVKFFPPEG